MLIEERGSPQDTHEARWLHPSMEAGRKELLNKCESCSLKSVRGSNCGRTRAAESPTQPQLPPYIQPRRSSARSLQVCRGTSEEKNTPNQYKGGGDIKDIPIPTK